MRTLDSFLDIPKKMDSTHEKDWVNEGKEEAFYYDKNGTCILHQEITYTGIISKIAENCKEE